MVNGAVLELNLRRSGRRATSFIANTGLNIDWRLRLSARSPSALSLHAHVQFGAIGETGALQRAFRTTDMSRYSQHTQALLGSDTQEKSA